jgi:hypothetical protein
MRFSLNFSVSAALFLVAAAATTGAFAPSAALLTRRQTTSCAMSTAEAASMADSGVPPASSQASDVAEEEIPTNLPSDVGMDYVPLATMLATGQLAEADQVRFSWSSY